MARALTENEVARQADEFWQLVGFVEPFPRSLETALLWALPLAVVKLPRLGLADLRDWLRDRGIDLCPDLRHRPLRACLVARAGQGFVFVDGADPDDEQRLSLAHEIAHYIRDYWIPRERALAALGDDIADVLDGRRQPSPDERLAGVLRGVRIGVFTHLMERGTDGLVERISVLAAEDAADRLALELLAPRNDVLARVKAAGIAWKTPNAFAEAATLLRNDFGLPMLAAERYADVLVLSQRPSRSFREWLGS